MRLSQNHAWASCSASCVSKGLEIIHKTPKKFDRITEHPENIIQQNCKQNFHKEVLKWKKKSPMTTLTWITIRRGSRSFSAACIQASRDNLWQSIIRHSFFRSCSAIPGWACNFIANQSFKKDLAKQNMKVMVVDGGCNLSLWTTTTY
jgi:hypothetical protein